MDVFVCLVHVHVCVCVFMCVSVDVCLYICRCMYTQVHACEVHVYEVDMFVFIYVLGGRVFVFVCTDAASCLSYPKKDLHPIKRAAVLAEQQSRRHKSYPSH